LLTIRQAAAECPDFDGARACRSVARAFLLGRQHGDQADAQIANLILAISSTLSSRKVAPVVCRDAARGIRVLAEGIADSAKARDARRLASNLCGPGQAVQKPDPFLVHRSLLSGPPKSVRKGDNAGDNAGDDVMADDFDCLCADEP
jgi:hypothetical protein